jgi:hypothetical protein
VSQEQLKDCSANEVLDLLSAAEEYLLPDLKKLCEHAATSLINTEIVAKMMSAADRFDAPLLRQACISYILGPDKQEVIEHPTFKSELEAYPLMLFPIIKAAPTLSTSGSSSSSSSTNKRQRTSENVIRPVRLSASVIFFEACLLATFLPLNTVNKRCPLSVSLTVPRACLCLSPQHHDMGNASP